MNPAGLMTQTASVLTASATTGSSGSVSYTYSNGAASMAAVPCSIQPRSAAEAARYGRDATDVLAVGYFPVTHAGTAVSTYLKSNAKVVVGATTWLVRGLPRDAGGRGVFLAVDLERADSAKA